MNDVALITGANQGIGLQIAKELAGKGLTVFVASRDFKRGQEAARTLQGDARPLQMDVTDAASIRAAAERIRAEVGHLDVLVNNAAIAHTTRRPDEPMASHAERTLASNVSLDEVRAVWETNVFGPLAVYQAMLPLLRQSRAARIVNVSSGLGSLTLVSDPTFPYRSAFGPVYAASKTAMNAMTVAMAMELESSGIKVNAVTPGFTKTNLNAFEGTETLEEGAAEAVRVALLVDGPTGGFTHATRGNVPW